MAIDFPNSPTTGDTYTAGDRTWIWDGTVWASYGNFPDPTVLKVDKINDRVGINNVSPTTALDVNGDLTVSGKVNATAPTSTKTASYTLAAGDEGTRIVMNNAGATTITVDDAVFAAGDTVWIHNIGAGTTTVTAGTATVNTAASLDLAQWEGGSLYFTSASSAIFFRGGGAGISALAADVFVAGAGGGGADGGGGAGQYNYASGQFLPLGTSMNVKITAGGSPSGTGNQARLVWTYNPGTTFIGPYVSHGGGSGGNGGVAGMTGACGGGGGRSLGAIVQGGPGRGLNGPDGRNGGQTGSGNTTEASGGGGAAESGNTDSYGHGGDGLANSITGTSTYYCGGGAGNGATNSGGLGGGGNNGVAGAANTGGGGGGGNKNGGSGVVIVRWLTGDATPTIGAGLTTSSATDGDYTVLTITGGVDTIEWN